MEVCGCDDELRLARASLPEAMLGIVEDGVVIEMAHRTGLDDVFHQFAADGCQGYGAVVGGCGWVPFLEHRYNVCFQPGHWNGTLVVRCLEYSGQ